MRMLGEIGLVVIYFGEPSSLMTASPDMQPLAELNLAHWKSDGVQRNSLNYARFPIYFGRKLAMDDNDKVKFGPSRLIHSTDDGSDLKTVEHSGKSLQAGREDLQDLETKMAIFGLSLLMPKTNIKTATERMLDKTEIDSTLRGLVRRFQDAMNAALYYMCQWQSKEFAGGIEYNVEFTAVSGEDAAVLLAAFEKQLLPRSVVVAEFQRRGLLNSELDIVEIEEALKAEGYSQPGLGELAGALALGAGEV
jgi:hypothetical protein